MSSISHYHSLDERFEAGPPFDALCQKCSSLNLLELFAGPRYPDFYQGFEIPNLDLFIGTIADFRVSAKDCRLCYLVIAFHDALHNSPNTDKRRCKGDVERCTLKPYRTEAILHMTDESNNSGKESVSTSVSLIFQDPDCPSLALSMERVARLTPRASSDAVQNDIVSRIKEFFRRNIHHNAWEAQKGHLQQGIKEAMADEPPLDQNLHNLVPSLDRQHRDNRNSVEGLHEVDFRPVELPQNAYLCHSCLFCLTDTSAVGRRKTLSFSETAEGSKIDWCSLRDWVGTCEKDHSACRPQLSDPITEGELCIRCIDVQSSTIVPIRLQTRYLALSYVWGTAHSELTDHIMRCVIGNNSTIMIESLPSTIRDAIQVTGGLGERYLWVDSLCLHQSDPTTIEDQIGQMDRIYENAVLTLVTSTSRDVYSEIPALRTNSRLRSVSEVHVQGVLIKAVCIKGAAIEFSGPWSGRGWTFQEWVLSRRCLFFSQNQIMFRCQELSGLESFQPPRITPLSMDTAMPKFWAGGQAERTIKAKVSLETSIWVFHTYTSLVHEYTTRYLSYAGDIIHAFTGILQKLERSSGMTFVDAMPAEDLLRALLWTPVQGQCRRPSFPSWAWVGWDNRVTYICWELVELSGEEALFAENCETYIDASSSPLKRLASPPFTMCWYSRVPTVLAVCSSYGLSPDYIRHRAFRLRCAEVALVPQMKGPCKKGLQVTSETRSVLVHQNAPGSKGKPWRTKLTDNLLHPITRKALAGPLDDNYEDESSSLIALNLCVGDGFSREEHCFSSHDAILLYEWDISGLDGRWHQKVAAMLFDRSSDGTVERVSLVSIRSKDWRTLPLVKKREELTLV